MLLLPILAFALAHPIGSYAMKQYSEDSWVVTDVILNNEFFATPDSFPKFDSIVFTRSEITVSYTDSDSKKHDSTFTYKIARLNVESILIHIIDSENSVRFRTLCRKDGKVVQFAFNLDPDNPPTGFDVKKDKIFLLKCLPQKK